MPPFKWPLDPSDALAEFAKRHPDAEAGALLYWAKEGVDALHFLADADGAYESSRVIPGDHSRDVVDVAHARWGTGTVGFPARAHSSPNALQVIMILKSWGLERAT